ncbi:hypothetical protein HYX04_01565 [Candidatus Woesearchaeota archaeon]|nr:hypothetical protein [Candidatus Woesearchaeota archaeon]
MDDKTQRERLEQELRFLKESFEAEVISKEEFEKGRDRIEKKLREIKQLEKEANKEGIGKEAQEEKEAAKISDSIEKKEETKIKLKVIQDEVGQHEHFEPVQIKAHPTEKIEEPIQEAAKEIKDEKKESKSFKYAVVFVVLLLIVFFSYSLLKEKKAPKAEQLKFVAACSSDDDCKQEGKEGFCINPRAKNAKCEFKEIQKTNVLVLNDRRNCFNCGTQRVLDILENWFGAISAKEIDYNTNEGKNIAEIFDAKMLPVYILGENITKNPGFEQFKAAFVKKDGNYMLSDDAAGSTFYFKRDNVPDKLDLFVIDGDAASIKAENNLKEFLVAFKEVKFEKHNENGALAKELNIKTFPTFLINNQIKFSGVLAAETIKDNFCRLNKLKGCERSLSMSLV